jgi:predicted nucleotidyltransferase
MVNDSLLQEVTRRLVEQFQPEQIILFGSYVWGTPTASSDLDVMVIVTDSDLSEYERSVQGHRSLMGLDVPKDVIVKTRTEFDFFRTEPTVEQFGQALSAAEGLYQFVLSLLPEEVRSE